MNENHVRHRLYKVFRESKSHLTSHTQSNGRKISKTMITGSASSDPWVSATGDEIPTVCVREKGQEHNDFGNSINCFNMSCDSANSQSAMPRRTVRVSEKYNFSPRKQSKSSLLIIWTCETFFSNLRVITEKDNWRRNNLRTSRMIVRSDVIRSSLNLYSGKR